MTALRYLLALLLPLTTVACAAPGADDQPRGVEETVQQLTLPSVAAGRATITPASGQHETAEQIIARLAATIPTTRLSIVYTAETDPNQLLGTPGGYVSKAAFVDTRIDPAQVGDTETGSIELGGSVEVFSNEADARARKQYLDQTLAELPLDVGERSSVHGPVLLRLSRHFSPEQAAEYEAALDA